MPPIEVGPARAVSAIDARLARAAGGEALPGANGAAAKSAASKITSTTASTSVETSSALNPGAAPVDTDRVATVKKAVESGSYPLIPAKIADAMIAAGVMLRSPK